SCQARGGAAIEAAAARRLGVAMGETRADGQISLEPVYCLGLCAIGPNALVDGRPMARIDSAALERIAGAVGA
ncbi:MAG TPA: NAD(P)H-dependent oxidoreductase subunit E, partial [Sphingobium sp.]